jgi:GAF domain-containing protein
MIGVGRLLEDAWEAGSMAEIPTAPRLLERVAVALQRSAVILRANGRHPEAARAEQFALRLGLTLDEPRATRKMRSLVDALDGCQHTVVLLERALDGAMSLIGGDLGNVQVCNVATGSLRIAAQAGFGSEFLEYFAAVNDQSSACGRAASRCSQTVIVDVNEDADFAPHREVAAASRFRAVQSTPLVDPDRRLRGVISTHFRHSHSPCRRDLQLMQWYGAHVAAALARQQNGPTALYEASAELHAQTARRHDSAAALMNETAETFPASRDRAEAAARQGWASRAKDRAEHERERVQAAVTRAKRTSAIDHRAGFVTPLDGGRIRPPAGSIDGAKRDLWV